ncbi:Ig-like domain-containing protein [Flammeovirga aprica]|uniref:Family 16 glycosylhydrolase n=1 Tax=Flammeovirga aprica JL-4 TaxID=694437 RepID=A0A7X9P273_9BACT|nr:family 16 glycosylhydrolase [Flammeovirga aprica]NME67813.1 family 16 glycosylhydrolase [Flammeovirga aprica JL-4]
MKHLQLNYSQTTKLLLSLLFFTLFSESVLAQQPTTTSNPSDVWEIRWSASDEFNGATPDWSKWIKTGNLPNTTAWKWNNDDNVKIENGVAALTMRQNANNASDGGTYFKSGILKSYQTFTYGYYEAKIKGADIGEGVCPSFWLFSNFDYSVGNGKTVYSEIDVVELQQFDWYEGHQDDIYDMDHNLHAVVMENGTGVWRRPKQHPNEQLNKYRAPWDPTKDYHIYGCEVNENEIIWYVDGIEVARKPNTYWYRPMNVTLSLGLRKPFVEFYNNRNNAVNPETDPEAKALLPGMPTTMYVDYVRVWEKSTTPAPPTVDVGEIGNPSFEEGDLSYWSASIGLQEVVSNTKSSGSYGAKVNNGNVAQVITLAANTTYTISVDGKVGSNGTSAFLGITDAVSGDFITNQEFSSTSFENKSISITTGASEHKYRVWYYSDGEAYCDNFTIGTDGTPPADVDVNGVSLNKNTSSIGVGEQVQLSASVSPSNATDKTVSWSTANASVATVSNGNVTGVGAGTTKITVTTRDGNFKAECTVTVTSGGGGGSGSLPTVGSVIWLKTLSDDYVTVNTSQGTALQATKSSVSSFEEFTVLDADGYFALQSVATNKYVTVASDNTVKCGATGIFERQKLTFELTSDGYLILKGKINGQYISTNSSDALVANQSNASNATKFTFQNGSSSRVTSTQQLKLEQEIKVYPNPYNFGNLYINLNKINSGTLRVYDVGGREFINKTFNEVNQIVLKHDELMNHSGLLIFQIVTKDGTATTRTICN